MWHSWKMKHGLVQPRPTPSASETFTDSWTSYSDFGQSLTSRSKLEDRLSPDGLHAATVIFLGDYCDRGGDTKGVLDWLLHLRDTRPHERTHFIAGNHDFAMAAYLGCLPTAASEELLESTRGSACTDDRIFRPQVEGGMHFQGRRWGGGKAYSAAATFRSYGVKFDYTTPAREALLAAVPNTHKDFLRGLAWVHEAAVPFAPGRLICVHAGLEDSTSVEEQLQALRALDPFAPAIQREDLSRVEALSGRRNVQGMPRELRGRALLVSGHHGFTRISSDGRIICDTCGGNDRLPLEAVILPAAERIKSEEDSPDEDTSSTSLEDEPLQDMV
eukprot:gnl/TRDRNA2_/TRDRNA2_83515_c0_seq2.p1 gnl/TRDRNA2_/TRDRNA2_83515_c0~~gnl/TRDRNA2_/TRDRNA2_83515_c0_seq2.p1  ORF type:complete len:331 (+),score=40.63 gnl/TRDRNA2_/TRDRNA2_83515_c0_seq2:288-1280(+)